MSWRKAASRRSIARYQLTGDRCHFFIGPPADGRAVRGIPGRRCDCGWSFGRGNGADRADPLGCRPMIFLSKRAVDRCDHRTAIEPDGRVEASRDSRHRQCIWLGRVGPCSSNSWTSATFPGNRNLADQLDRKLTITSQKTGYLCCTLSTSRSQPKSFFSENPPNLLEPDLEEVRRTSEIRSLSPPAAASHPRYETSRDAIFRGYSPGRKRTSFRLRRKRSAGT